MLMLTVDDMEKNNAGVPKPVRRGDIPCVSTYNLKISVQSGLN